MLPVDEYVKISLAQLDPNDEDFKKESWHVHMMAGTIMEIMADGTSRCLMPLPDDVSDEMLKSDGIEPVLHDGKRYMLEKGNHWELRGEDVWMDLGCETDYNAFTGESGAWRKVSTQDGTLSMDGFMEYERI